VRRGARDSGIAVDPERVRSARVGAGLSLREIAGDDVSATFIHFVERGVSRPSRRVLALIARRTGKPIGYFMAAPSASAQQAPDLAAELIRVANQARQFRSADRLTTLERDTMKLIELTLRQAAELTKSVRANASTK
jgi:transcriptional regulator with XRE-family HTH domain